MPMAVLPDDEIGVGAAWAVQNRTTPTPLAPKSFHGTGGGGRSQDLHRRYRIQCNHREYLVDRTGRRADCLVSVTNCEHFLAVIQVPSLRSVGSLFGDKVAHTYDVCRYRYCAPFHQAASRYLFVG